MKPHAAFPLNGPNKIFFGNRVGCLKKYFLIFLALFLVVSSLFLFIGCRDEDKTSDNENDSTFDSKNESSSENTDKDTEPEPEPVTPFILTKFEIAMSRNSNMCEDIRGVISENTVTLTVTAPIDRDVFKAARVSASSDGGIVDFNKESINGNGTINLLADNGCYCIIRDDNGLSRKYRIEVNYISTGLPVVVINVKNGTEVASNEEYTAATIKIDCSGVEGSFLPEGFDSLELTNVNIRGRGNSTWKWDKKPYKLKFNEKTEILGMPAEKDWALLANYADYSLIRNYVALDSAKLLTHLTFTASQYPVNVFVNGTYRGVYTIGEHLEVDKNRINLSKDSGEGIEDTSFLLEIGGTTDTDTWDVNCFHTDLVRYCKVEYPKEEVLTSDQVLFIKNYVKEANKAIKNNDGYEEYIDMDSVIDWFIAQELFYNLDSMFRRSCFLTKEPGELLKLGPLWDFDLAFGNLYNDFEEYTSWSCLSQEHEYIEDNWFCYLLEYPEFRDKLKTRWNEIGKDLLTHTLACIDNVGSIVSISAKYNFEVWDILGSRVLKCQPLYISNYKTYEEQIDFLRTFVINRWNWMNENI